MRLQINIFRIILLFAGISAFLIVFFGYGKIFLVNDFFKSTIATLFSILIGFQTALFAFSPTSIIKFRKGVNEAKAMRHKSNQFNRQFILFWLFLISLCLICLGELLVDPEITEKIERLYAGIIAATLIWSYEIPKLILSSRESSVEN